MRLEARVESCLQKLAAKQEQAPSKEQLNAIQRQITTLASKEQVEALQNVITNISRLQSHLQKKQDQLAYKKDLLHSTIANERQRSSSVISSPLLHVVYLLL
jgi:uncharacterized protein YpuA (DUF1002 family)